MTSWVNFHKWHSLRTNGLRHLCFLTVSILGKGKCQAEWLDSDVYWHSGALKTLQGSPGGPDSLPIQNLVMWPLYMRTEPWDFF